MDYWYKYVVMLFLWVVVALSLTSHADLGCAWIVLGVESVGLCSSALSDVDDGEDLASS